MPTLENYSVLVSTEVQVTTLHGDPITTYKVARVVRGNSVEGLVRLTGKAVTDARRGVLSMAIAAEAAEAERLA